MVLQTGGGTPLVSKQEALNLSGVTAPEITFSFGFFSDEVPAPNVFLDSFTVTLLDNSSSAAAVLTTVDASGAVWVPPSMGGILLSDSSIVRFAILPPGSSPISGRGVAYSVTLLVPQQISGPDVTLYFDLFDNGDQAMSLGWYTAPHVLNVPEPRVASLFTLALLGILIIRRKRIHAVEKP